MKKRISTLLALLLLLSMSCLFLPVSAAGVTERKDLVYDSSRTANNTYDLYFPKDLKQGQTVNIVLFLHSGSWTSGDKSEQAADCRAFAQKGYVTATVNYRLYNTTNMVTKQANYAWTVQDMLDDIASCLNAVSTQIEKAGYKVGNAGLFGFSAGGHLALLYSYKQANAASVPVTLVMSQCGPADFHTETWSGSSFANGLSLQGILYLANRDISVSESGINRVSPAYYAKKKPIPTVAIYGMQDSVIGTGHSKKLTDALDDAGADYVVLESKNAGHTNQFPEKDSNAFYSTCYSYCKKYLNTGTQKETKPEAPVKEGLPTWAKVLIVIGVLGILAVVFWILVIRAIWKKYKSKKERRQSNGS